MDKRDPTHIRFLTHHLSKCKSLDEGLKVIRAVRDVLNTSRPATDTLLSLLKELDHLLDKFCPHDNTFTEK